MTALRNLLLLSAVLLLNSISAENLVIKKCCKKDKVLNVTSNTCVEIGDTKFEETFFAEKLKKHYTAIGKQVPKLEGPSEIMNNGAPYVVLGKYVGVPFKFENTTMRVSISSPGNKEIVVDFKYEKEESSYCIEMISDGTSFRFYYNLADSVCSMNNTVCLPVCDIITPTKNAPYYINGVKYTKDIPHRHLLDVSSWDKKDLKNKIENGLKREMQVAQDCKYGYEKVYAQDFEIVGPNKDLLVMYKYSNETIKRDNYCLYSKSATDHAEKLEICKCYDLLRTIKWWLIGIGVAFVILLVICIICGCFGSIQTCRNISCPIGKCRC